MKTIDIEELDLNNAYFHFTLRDNLPSIEIQGLRAQIGDASEMVQDKPRVCLSKSGKGILGIKNSFIHEFKKLRICDIPKGYQQYFDITDFSSTEIVGETLVYDALQRRFRDEVYMVVNAQEGEDFLGEDIYGLGSEFDIKGKENHDIEASKIDGVVKAASGDTALDVVHHLYERILSRNPGKEDLVKSMNSDLAAMLDYLIARDSQHISPLQIEEATVASGTGVGEINDATGQLRKDLQPTHEKQMEVDD